MTRAENQTAESKLAEAREWADWYEAAGDHKTAEFWRLTAEELARPG